jgi:hypothetical protein
MEDNKEIKILTDKDRVITRRKLFESKADFHKEQARLPFEEKIKILVRLQKIASAIKEKGEMAWEIYK